jgi:uncharacterized protein DUF6547
MCEEALMDQGLAAYKAFIDGLVEEAKQECPDAGGLRRRQPLYPVPSEVERRYNDLADNLTSEQREFVAHLVQKQWAAATHAILAYITWNGYRLFQDGVELPKEPFGTDNFWDFMARLNGTAWPDEPDEEGTLPQPEEI